MARIDAPPTTMAQTGMRSRLTTRVRTMVGIVVEVVVLDDDVVVSAGNVVAGATVVTAARRGRVVVTRTAAVVVGAAVVGAAVVGGSVLGGDGNDGGGGGGGMVVVSCALATPMTLTPVHAAASTAAVTRDLHLMSPASRCRRIAAIGTHPIRGRQGTGRRAQEVGT